MKSARKYQLYIWSSCLCTYVRLLVHMISKGEKNSCKHSCVCLIIFRAYSNPIISTHVLKSAKVQVSINYESDYVPGVLTTWFWFAWFRKVKRMCEYQLCIWLSSRHTLILLLVRRISNGEKIMGASIMCLIIFRAYSHPIISANVSGSAKFKWALIVHLIIFRAYSPPVINSHDFNRSKVHVSIDCASDYLPRILIYCYWCAQFQEMKSACEKRLNI